MSTPDITIEDGEAYVPQLLDLIKRYTDSLGRDLAFQHLDEELADLTHKYGEGNGRLFAALVDGIVAGVVAYHRFDDTHAEMKRLYVAPEAAAIAHFAERLDAAGINRSDQMFRLPWDSPLDTALLADVIRFNVADKAGLTSFWRPRH